MFETLLYPLLRIGLLPLALIMLRDSSERMRILTVEAKDPDLSKRKGEVNGMEQLSGLFMRLES